MTFIVGDNCIKCKHTDCVEVCPVDCFYEGPNFLVIHPDECIDCALCEPECPGMPIFAEDEIPAGQEVFLELNAELADVWPNITEQKEPPPDAAEWDGINKFQILELLILWNREEHYTASFTAPVAQLDRVGGFEPLGRGFESLRVHQIQKPQHSWGFCIIVTAEGLIQAPD